MTTRRVHIHKCDVCGAMVQIESEYPPKEWSEFEIVRVVKRMPASSGRYLLCDVCVANTPDTSSLGFLRRLLPVFNRKKNK